MAQLLGEYLKTKGKQPAEVLSACDLFPEVFGYDDIVCDNMAFMDHLPYDDESFDIVYAIEVLEHLANPYEFIKQAFRIVKPGGKLIVSVPNLLNLNSRVSFLLTGFFFMFGPLSFDDKDAGRLSGHIMPLSCYYLEHRMKKVGFGKIDLHADKLKKSSIVLFHLLNPFIKGASWLYERKIKKNNELLFETNRSALANVNSKAMLCSRSSILVGSKA